MKVIPSDLVREILLRVPYEWHDNLKVVCGKWDCMVSNPKFYEDRKICGASEHLVCLIQDVRVNEDDDFGEDEDDDFQGLMKITILEKMKMMIFK